MRCFGLRCVVFACEELPSHFSKTSLLGTLLCTSSPRLRITNFPQKSWIDMLYLQKFNVFPDVSLETFSSYGSGLFTAILQKKLLNEIACQTGTADAKGQPTSRIEIRRKLT